MSGLVVDLFAGGGGASVGLEAALGRAVDIAINHDAVALAVHKANHPGTRHLEADIWEVRPRAATGGRPVDVLWASPDCTHFSVAKGDVPRRQDIRSLAWAVIRWAKDVRPRVIFLENVAEFRGWGPLGPDGRPDKGRMGLTFKRWVGRLQGLGYVVDYRVLDASHYGAPTRRRRLFMVARCDGQAIRWPEPTHGEGLFVKPVRTAAECIDWSLPCPSIFARERPLAEKTLWRIAQGIRRFVLEDPRPFLVGVGGRAGLSHPTGPEHPVGTITAKNDRALCVPTLVQTGYGEREGQAARVPGLHKPLGTMVNGQKHALVAAFLAKHFGGVVGVPLSEPTGTITAKDHHGLVSASLEAIDDGHGDRVEAGRGGRTRGSIGRNDLEAPEPERHADVGTAQGRSSDAQRLLFGEGVRGGSAVLDSGASSCVDGGERSHPDWNGDKPQGRPVQQQRAPQPGARHAGREQPPLVSQSGSEAAFHGASSNTGLRYSDGSGAEEPGPQLLGYREDVGDQSDDGVSRHSINDHTREVRAFLTAFYGQDGSPGKGQSLRDPMRTLTAKHRLGLVTVEGADYQIVDIGLRMLQPHELLRAQFGRFAEAYDLSAARTKAAKVRLIGNSVAPEVAEALVAANIPQDAEAVA